MRLDRCLLGRARARLNGCLLATGMLFGSAPALAQVMEPDGVVVPQAAGAGETPLQSYFDGEGEAINAVNDASAEPGVFSPLCDFEATLVMSESQAEAGISWYNVPADPTSAPTAVYEVIPVGPAATALGQTFGSAAIRDNPNYAGGNIGFVLTKQCCGNVYYSEYQRNVLCSACASPDHWKMMLAYPSTVHANTYYLAFEDWQGANQTESPNDGDFNDKVFRVGGVVCLGGGEPCDVPGGIGVCAAGRTECVVGGALECRPQLQPTAEMCDNFDNDCDGEVDEGEGLCEVPNVCFRGKCVPPCGGGEFACPQGFTCLENVCIDLACQDVLCSEGQICVGGNCVGGCESVVCPLGQSCQLGRCVDPCQSAACGLGEVCRDGVCVVNCSCGGCPVGEECAPTGECVSPGCGAITCGVGEECVSGACVDACLGAACPGGVPCAAGVCGEFDPSTDPGAPDPVDPITLPPEGVTPTGTGGSGAGSSPGPNGVALPPTSDSGCGCRHAHSRSPVGAMMLALAMISGLGLRRRRVRVQCASAERPLPASSGDRRHRGSVRH